MKKTILAIAILGLATAANAGQWGLQVHVHSNHFADRAIEDWHEPTDGFALRYIVNKTWAVQAGHYRNEYTVVHASYNLFTNYAIVDYTAMRWKGLSAGLYGGVNSGYNDLTLADKGKGVEVTGETKTGIAPFGGLMGRVELDRYNLTLRAQPDEPNSGPATIRFELGVVF